MTSLKRLAAAITIVFVLATDSAQGQLMNSGTWAVSNGGNGRLYEVYLAPGGITWPAAKAAALALGSGADLATPVTGAENAFIFTLTSPVPGIFTPQLTSGLGSYGPWVGGTLTASGWTWDSGEPFCYTNWGPGEPNNGCAGFLENHIHYAIGANSSTGPVPTDNWNDLNDVGCLPAIIPTGYVVEYTLFDTTITQTPAGIAITTGMGFPFSLYLNAIVVTLPPAGDPCLDGWFFGINPTLGGLLSLLMSGPPIFGMLPASGSVAFFIPTGPIGAFGVDYVGINLSTGFTILQAGKPKTIITM